MPGVRHKITMRKFFTCEVDSNHAAIQYSGGHILHILVTFINIIYIHLFEERNGRYLYRFHREDNLTIHSNTLMLLILINQPPLSCYIRLIAIPGHAGLLTSLHCPYPCTVREKSFVSPL